TLALDATTGSWNVANGGTLKNGTVTTTGGAALTATGGTLDNSTLNTDLLVQGGSLTVVNGLTLHGKLTLSGSTLFCGGTQTLTGIGEILFGGTSSSMLYIQNADGSYYYGTDTLTIGSGIKVHGSQNGTIAGYGYYGTRALINQGTIVADSSGR